MFTKGRNANPKEEVLIAVGAQPSVSQAIVVETAVNSPALSAAGSRQTASVMSEGLEVTGQIKSQGSIEMALLQKSDDEGFTSRIHGVRRGA